MGLRRRQRERMREERMERNEKRRMEEKHFGEGKGNEREKEVWVIKGPMRRKRDGKVEGRKEG